MPANLKTVYLYVAGVASAMLWVATPAQIADLVSRWDAVRNGGDPDALVYTQSGYVVRIDLHRVVALQITA